MSVATQFVLHGILNSSTFLSQIENAVLSPGVEKLIGQPAGLPNPMWASNIGVNPRITFDTTQLSTLLGLGGTNGFHLIDLSGANTDLYWKKTVDLSTRVADATTSHTRSRMAQACLSVDRISMSHRGEAKASCTLYALYNGSTVPLVITGSVALAGTPSSALHYLAGKCTFTVSGPTTTTIAGVQDIDISFNRQVSIRGGDGEQYPTFAFEQSVNPVITITSLDTTLPANVGPLGLSLTGFSVTARALATTGPVADATTSHCRFYGTAGLAIFEDTTAGGNSEAMTKITITPVAASASADAMTIDVAAAIP